MYEIKVKTRVAAEPLAQADIEKYLQISDTTQYETMSYLVAAARDMVQKESGFGMGQQTLQLQLTNQSHISLPYPPIVSITSVKYIDELVVSAAMTEGYDNDWYKEGLDNLQVHVNVFNGQEILIEYVCGYTEATLPAWARAAILTLIKTWLFEPSQNLKMTSEVAEICAKNRVNPWLI